MQPGALPRVLCVDDDEDSCEILSLLLKCSEIETKTVGTADPGFVIDSSRTLRLVFAGLVVA